jgi:cyclophilin family peptidyl-prolyl cis-trans isomerase
MPTEKRQRQKEGKASRQAALAAYRRKAARRRQIVSLVLVVGLVFAVLAFATRGGGGSKAASPTTTTLQPIPSTLVPAKGNSKVCPAADGSSKRATEFTAAPGMCIDTAKTYTAKVDTDAGSFTIALDPKQAPKTVNNFVFLARYHYFNSSLFHRVETGFVVQGGDPNKGDSTGGPGYTIPDEFPTGQGLYKVGTVAMANAGPNSGGSQFFIVVGDRASDLPPSYSLFGNVTAGMDVVHKIETDGQTKRPDGKPKIIHQIKTVTITEV